MFRSFRRPQGDANELIERGYDALAHRDWREAMRLARALHRMRNTGGFEIEARAEWGRDRPDRAIQILRAGIAKVPSCYPLWSYLGEFLSDCGHYEEAAHAFEQVRRYSGDHLTADLNLAIVRHREGRHLDGLTILANADVSAATPHQRWEMALLEAWLYNQLERYDETLHLLDHLPEYEEATGESRARMEAMRAQALLKGRDDPIAAAEAARRAYRWDRGNEGALYVLREVSFVRSPSAYHLEMSVWLTDPDGRSRRWEITMVAEDAATGLALLRDLEPEPQRDGIRLIRCVKRERCPDEPIGIYNCVPAPID